MTKRDFLLPSACGLAAFLAARLANGVDTPLQPVQAPPSQTSSSPNLKTRSAAPPSLSFPANLGLRETSSPRNEGNTSQDKAERASAFRGQLDAKLSNGVQQPFLASISRSINDDMREYMTAHINTHIVSFECGGSACKLNLRHANAVAAAEFRKNLLSGTTLNRPDTFDEKIGCNINSFDDDQTLYVDCFERDIQ